MRFNALSKCGIKTTCKACISRFTALSLIRLFVHSRCLFRWDVVCVLILSLESILNLYCFHSSFAIIALSRNALASVFNRQMFRLSNNPQQLCAAIKAETKPYKKKKYRSNHMKIHQTYWKTHLNRAMFTTCSEQTNEGIEWELGKIVDCRQQFYT